MRAFTRDSALIWWLGVLLAIWPTAKALASASLDDEPTVALLAPVELGGPAGTYSMEALEEMSLEDLLDLPVATTGGRREQSLTTALSTISILTHDELADSPYLYLGDLLASLPGFDVRWGNMQRYYIAVRGLGGSALNSRVLLLWDGQPMNDPFTGELSAGHFVPLVDIERIEVIRGPGSSVYGANAYSGVVNVISKRGAGVLPDLTSSITLGSFGSGRLQAAYGKQLGPVAIDGSVEALTSEGPFEAQNLPGSASGQVKNDDIRSAAVQLGLRWQELQASARTVVGERGRPGQFPTDEHGNLRSCSDCHTADSPRGQGIKYPSTESSCGSCHLQPADRETVVRTTLAGSYRHRFGNDVELAASAYHNEWRTLYSTYPDRELLQRPREVRQETAQRASGGELHLSHKLQRQNIVVAGVEGRRTEVASSNIQRDDGSQHAEEFTAALFAEDEIRPWHWLSLTGGGRIDLSSQFGVQASPRAGVAVEPMPGAGLRASISRAFRNPSFSELYVDERRGKYNVCGNPELRPEQITAAELHGMYTFSWPLKLALAATAFRNESRDLIAFRAQGLNKASFFNVERAEVLGAEFEADFELPFTEGLHAYGNYAYQLASDGDGQRLPYAPEHKVNAGLHFQRDPVGGMVQLRLLGERRDNMGATLPGYATLDASLRLNVAAGFGFRLWITNVTDAVYQQSLGIPAARRAFFLSFDYDPDHASETLLGALW